MHFSVTLIVLVLCLLLMRGDLARRRLPNLWVALLGLMFFAGAALSGMSLERVGLHMLVALAAFALLLPLFVLGGLGGGDVKLGSVVMLWAGPPEALAVLAIVTWTGAALGILGWLSDRWLAPAPPQADPGEDEVAASARGGLHAAHLGRRLGHALSARRGVPYGVALAVGALYAAL